MTTKADYLASVARLHEAQAGHAALLATEAPPRDELQVSTIWLAHAQEFMQATYLAWAQATAEQLVETDEAFRALHERARLSSEAAERARAIVRQFDGVLSIVRERRRTPLSMTERDFRTWSKSEVFMQSVDATLALPAMSHWRQQAAWLGDRAREDAAEVTRYLDAVLDAAQTPLVIGG